MAQYEHFDLPIEQFYTTTSRQCSTRMFGTVHRKSRALDSVRREERGVHRSTFGAFSLKHGKCTERLWRVPRSKWGVVTLEQLSRAVERAEAALTLQGFFGAVLADLCKEKGMSGP